MNSSSTLVARLLLIAIMRCASSPMLIVWSDRRMDAGVGIPRGQDAVGGAVRHADELIPDLQAMPRRQAACAQRRIQRGEDRELDRAGGVEPAVAVEGP